MNRRDFLQVLGIGIAATVAPLAVAKQVFLPLELPALSAYPHFIPTSQYGEYVMLSSVHWDNDEAIQIARDILDPKVCEVVPPQYRDKIEWIVCPPSCSRSDPLAQRDSVGWKYTP